MERKIFRLFIFLSVIFYFFSIYAVVNATTTTVDVELTSIFDEENPNISKTIPNVDYGSKIQLDSHLTNGDYTFAFWVVNGVVRRDLPVNHQFVVTSKMDIHAVFSPNDAHVVLFMDSNGKLLDTQFVENGQNASEPAVSLPNKPGLSIAEPKWKTAEGEASLENINKNMVFVLQYQSIMETEFDLVVNNGSGSGKYSYNQLVTVTAEAELDGKQFSHWEENGHVVSFQRTYSFSMLSNREVTAVYLDSKLTLAPIISLNGDLQLREGYHSYLAQFFVPEGYELIEYGMLTSQNPGNINLESTGVKVYQGANYLDASNEFVMSFPIGSMLAVRAYLVVKADADNTITTHYNSVVLPQVIESSSFEIDQTNDVSYEVSLNNNTFSGVSYLGQDLVEDVDYTYLDNTLTLKGAFLTYIYRFNQTSYSLVLKTFENNNVSFNLETINAQYKILNAGFETGNLYGWNSYAIWKGETGMIAWTDERVVSGGYFDQQFSYNKDGNYNLGIYGGSISKDSGQERMGHLRSSDFILGGSGWLSFKLGGGRDSSFAFVSVRRTADDVEVARFGNHRFNSGSDTGNSEAYLYQYYFDLSTVANLGESLYITISDTASSEWCVLAADSFYTYYEDAPVYNPEELAVNIVPSILNIDTADNTIKNGYFDNNLNDWSNVTDQYRIENGYVMSNNHNGDAGTGVLRSSAFNVIGNKYLRLDWAGAIRYDKQLFISIKEVGTNIEVLRYVRRDNLSGKDNGDFDNHMLDLTSLDEGKLYYLELSDNLNAGWGLIKMDSIRFVNEDDWNNVVAGDRAVAISHLEKNFSYYLPYSE